MFYLLHVPHIVCDWPRTIVRTYLKRPKGDIIRTATLDNNVIILDWTTSSANNQVLFTTMAVMCHPLLHKFDLNETNCNLCN